MRGIYLESDLLASPAFKSLSRWGMRVYLGFLSRRVIVKKRDKSRGDSHVITNNGKIEFCYSTALSDGIPRQNFRDAVDELISKGFIDLSHQGAGGRSRDKSTYSIVERWRKWNTPDYQETPHPRIRNTKEGQGWSAYHTQKRSVSKSILQNPPSSIEIDTRKQKSKVIGVLKTIPGKKNQKAINA